MSSRMLAYVILSLWLLALTVTVVTARGAVSERDRSLKAERAQGFEAQPEGRGSSRSLTVSTGRRDARDRMHMRHLPSATRPDAPRVTGRAVAAQAGMSRAAIVRLIHRTWRPYGRMEQERAVCIAQAESGLRPAAVGADSWGLFQLDRNTWDPARNPRARPIVGPISWKRILEPAYNIRVAYRIWKHTGGWRPAWNATAGRCEA